MDIEDKRKLAEVTWLNHAVEDGRLFIIPPGGHHINRLEFTPERSWNHIQFIKDGIRKRGFIIHIIDEGVLITCRIMKDDLKTDIVHAVSDNERISIIEAALKLHKYLTSGN